MATARPLFASGQGVPSHWLPPARARAVSNQIYIHQSADAQLDSRMSIYTGMNRPMLRQLQDTLHIINPFIQQFKSAGETVAGGSELELIIRADTGDVDCRRYNVPTAAGEVAALLPGEPTATPPRYCDSEQKQPAAAHC